MQMQQHEDIKSKGTWIAVQVKVPDVEVIVVVNHLSDADDMDSFT